MLLLGKYSKKASLEILEVQCYDGYWIVSWGFCLFWSYSLAPPSNYFSHINIFYSILVFLRGWREDIRKIKVKIKASYLSYAGIINTYDLAFLRLSARPSYEILLNFKFVFPIVLLYFFLFPRTLQSRINFYFF